MGEERERILTLLEDGRITAEQAARLIEALGVHQSESPTVKAAGIRVRRHGVFRTLDILPDIVANAVQSGLEVRDEDTQEFVGKRDLSVKTVSGDVTVGASSAEMVSVSYAGGMVKIRSRGEVVQVRSISGDVDATMPAAGTLEAETVSGEIDIDGLAGRIALKSVSGDVTLASVAGEVSITTVTGDVQLVRCQGRVWVESKSGDIELKASGNIAGRLVSIFGDIELALPAAVNLELELHLEDWEEHAGEIKVDLSGQFEELERRDGYVYLKVGTGGPKFVCRTRAGDITVRNTKEA